MKAKRKVNNFTELSPASEAASCTAIQELPSFLWNPKFHYHNSPPLLPILSPINPVHTTPSYLFATNNKNKNIRYQYRGINKFNRG
jgi:hypothetical protein